MSDSKNDICAAGLLIALLVAAWSPVSAQPIPDEMLGRYKLIYDSTYIWPDGSGGYDYVRKFISEVQLDEEGRSALSRPATPILSKDDKITVAAYTRLASGEILQADTSDMVTRIMPDDRRWIFVNFRQAEPGAVLHLEWLLTSKEANIAGKRFLGRTVPVERAVVVITVPETWVFNFALSAGVAAEQKLEISPVPGGPSRASHFWIANNIPSLFKEEFSPPVERLIPCLYFSFDYDKGVVQTDTVRVDWAYLAELYNQELRAFTRSNSRLNSVIDSISDRSSDSHDRARMAYDWLGDNFRPFASEVTLDGSINDAVTRGSGTQAEAGAILFAMFERLGVYTMAYLTATRDVGEPMTQVPAFFWFDRILLTAAFGEDTIWIDPYYQLAQMDILPFEDQGARALCVTGGNGEFVDVPTLDYQENGKAIHLKLDIDSAGSLSGEATEIYSGAMIPEISSFLRGLEESGRKLPWEKRLARTFPSARISQFVVLPPDSAGQVFRIGYSFDTGPIVRPFADRAYIPLDLLGRWADMPDLNGSVRRTPIEIRRPRFELERISLKISRPFEVEYLPANFSENLDIGDIYSVIRGDRKSVTITRGLGLKKSSLPFSEYNSLRNFLNKARAEADKNIILRRVN
ncbi:MAG: hypothetical protein A2W25_00175 [candidate division Zixibacteria bacterium RBG_16_53_22]|nr:MAG: hypothetical protein A2W25_00175 [candidate division Zixibacteria bacterium RBG_16_53_22]